MGSSLDRQNYAAERSDQRAAPTPKGVHDHRQGVAPPYPNWAPGGGQLTAPSVLSLQRTAGNKATSQLIERMRAIAPESTESTAGFDNRSVGLAPAHDPASEAEADNVAAAATRRWDTARRSAGSGPSSGAAGGSAEHMVARAVAPELSGRPGALDRIRSVEFDASRVAAQQSEAIGARGFAQGNRVAFAEGELDMTSSRGFDLAAHEMAHVALHSTVSGGALGEAGSNLVHAKLRGTAQAAEAMGGEQTTKGFRGKLASIGIRAAKTNWDRILDGLRAYERLEETLLSNGTPDQRALASAKPKLLKVLSRVESDLLAWQEANPEPTELMDQIHDLIKEGRQQRDDKDKRDKSNRRQTVALLLPRVRSELEALRADSWASTLGLSDSQVMEKGRQDQGGKNQVQELHYQTEQGEFSGYFKADTGFNATTEGHETDVGIRQWDPNYGSRSVAMYRLDQLLGAGVTARVEFAVHDGKLGTVMETATGTRANETEIAFRNDSKGLAPNAVSLEDATLQRCLNKLQILDAIAGQLDRHAGNYFIQHKGGNVTGVTGIDLDMAFGRDMGTPDRNGAASLAQNYRGLPSQFDEDFANRILSITDDMVASALRGLLHPKEVEATIERFRHVQLAILGAKNTGMLKSDWNSGTATASIGDKKTMSYQRSNYSQDLVPLATGTVENIAMPAISEAVKSNLPDIEHPKMLKDYLELLLPTPNGGSGPIVSSLVPLIHAGKVLESDIENFVHKVVEELSSDHDWLNNVIVLSQDNDTIHTLSHGTITAVDKAIERVMAGWKVRANSKR